MLSPGQPAVRIASLGGPCTTALDPRAPGFDWVLVWVRGELGEAMTALTWKGPGRPPNFVVGIATTPVSRFALL